MNILIFIGAILFICLAHFIRIIRWKCMIKVYEKPDDKSLICGLSIGYLLNCFIPLKLGDIGRIIYSGKKMKNKIPLALSTVVVDRYLDIVCVGIIFGLAAIFKDGFIHTGTVLFYCILAGIVTLGLFVLFIFNGFFKKVIKAVAGLFNVNIETYIMQFAWSLIRNFKDIAEKISKIKLILLTISMWATYIASYAVFALFLRIIGVQTDLFDVIYTLFTFDGITSSTGALVFFSGSALSSFSLYFALYMVVPSLILFVVSLIVKSRKVEENEDYLRLIPHMDTEDRRRFLESYFAKGNIEYFKDYLKVNQGVSIIRDYSAGSNARTILCTDGKTTFFRKYAFGDDGEKLYAQVEWIRKFDSILPLPEIICEEKEEGYCFYDMPYSGKNIGMFEYVHSMPVDKAWNILMRVLDTLETSVYRKYEYPVDMNVCREYIQKKATDNLKRLNNSKLIRDLQSYDTIIINGREYRNLSAYSKYLEEDYLLKVFANDTISEIHGDLTIENIICTHDENGQDDFYLIDPNTGNVHDSPNLDYAKLLQSFHGGYEFLMSAGEPNISENRIDFLYTRSMAYDEIMKMFSEYMMQNFGIERTRSIFFHEIIHWLRLMPYKIRKDEKRAVLFYAGMLMVIQDVIDRFPNLEGSNE